VSWVCVDQRVAQAVGIPWAMERIGMRFPFHNPVAIMLIEGDRMLASVLFTDYDEVNIGIHVASDGSKRWLTRKFLRACFAYPFEQLKVRRVTGLVAASNASALRFDLHLGFQVEGRLRKAAQDGSDLLVLGMLRHECRHLREEHEQRFGTVCA
jgi:RimJ/RimL family protein N-acetyltransferase